MKEGEKREWIVPDGMWSELLSGTGKALGVYQEDYKKGCMVISEQQFGKGKACYVGTCLLYTSGEGTGLPGSPGSDP